MLQDRRTVLMVIGILVLVLVLLHDIINHKGQCNDVNVNCRGERDE